MFSAKYPSRSERTGKQWLKECSESPMLNRISHGLYEKSLRLIDEDNIKVIKDGKECLKTDYFKGDTKSHLSN